MANGIWMQEILDDTLIFSYSSFIPQIPPTLLMSSVHPPLMDSSVPPPLMASSVPTPGRMRYSNHFHRRTHRYEVPPRMRTPRALAAAVAASLESNAAVVQNSGLSPECISHFLLTTTFSREAITPRETIICTICQDEINEEEEEENISTLGCSHSYHASCIKKWLLIKNECAVCRASVIPR